MKSQRDDIREAAIALRQEGQSIKAIHRTLGVPVSTLSGWLYTVNLTPAQRQHLSENSQRALALARTRAASWHRSQKVLRKLQAKHNAEQTLGSINITNAILDLALAMIYLGEGTKTDNNTALASSDPTILRFFLSVLRRNYGIMPDQIRCDLHLRTDQDPELSKIYWSQELSIPIERFRYVAIDKRSVGKPTYDRYKGVCAVSCGNVAIQRKLVYLYKLFCERVANLGD